MWHAILIALHATGGSVALVAGVAALRRGTLYAVHLWSLVATILFLALAVGAEWSTLDGVGRVLFVALSALGVFMIARAVLAWPDRPVGTSPSARYVWHLGFNIVALFDAFTVIAVLDLGAPIWLVVTAAVAVAVAGHFARHAVSRRLVPSSADRRVDLPA